MMTARSLLLALAAALLADAAANVEDPEYDRERFPETFEPKEEPTRTSTGHAEKEIVLQRRTPPENFESNRNITRYRKFGRYLC